MKTVRNSLLGMAFIGIFISSIQMSVAHAQDLIKRPVLHEFITQVMQEHPSLLSVEANQRAVSARAQAKSKPIYNPEFDIGYVNNRDKDKDIGISQTIDWFGKRRARTSVGNAEILAAESSFLLAKKDLLTEILQSLTNYNTSFTLYKVAENRTQLSKDFLELANRRNQAGELPRSEFLTAMLDLSESQAAKNEAANILSQDKENLIALVGAELEIWPTLTGVPIADDALTFVYDIQYLPEMILAKNQVDIFKAQIKVAKSNRMPDPTIGIRVGQEGGGSRFDAQPRSTTVGVQLSLPIPIWNSFKAEVLAAGADFNQAEQNYLVVQNQVRARLEASMNRYQSTADAWEEWSKQGALPLSEQRSLLRKLLDSQEISAVDYLVQLNQTFEVERTSIALNGRLWNAWFTWQNSSNNLDKWLETIQ